MGIEVATYISQLVTSNPAGADDYSTADDHLRLMKTVVKNTFPNANGAINPTPAEFNRLVGLTSQAEEIAHKNVANGYAGLGAGAQLANAQVAVGNVTQHQAALAIAFSQLTGTASNAQIPQGAVTQHQAALAIVFSQLTGTASNAQIPQGAVTQHQAALALAASQLTSGSIPDARVPASNVTQHESSLGTSTATASRVVRRDASGNIFGAGFNQNSSAETPTIGNVIVENSGGDGYLRKSTLTHTKRQLVLNCTIQADPGGTPSGTAGDVFFYY